MYTYNSILEDEQIIANKKNFYTLLLTLSDEYYNNGSSPLSDNEFDSLKELYEKMHKQKFNYMGSNGKTPLPCYMGSLNKCKDEHSIELYKNRCTVEYRFDSDKKDHQYVISDKIDGISILLKFDGIQTQMFTRGDGSFGQDISHLVQYIQLGSLNYAFIQRYKTEPIIVRGELVIYKDIYEKKYKNDFKNPRNMVAGIINSKEIRKDILSDFTFVCYSLKTESLYKQDVYDEFLFLKSLGFIIPKIQLMTNEQLNVKSLSEYLNTYKLKRPYEIDGLVVSDCKRHTEINGENPKYTIAFKMGGEQIESVVVDVEWAITKHGVLKPRVRIQPVLLSGVKITYLSGFNAKFIQDNRIGKGSVVLVTRSGDVIPHIIKCVQPSVPIFPECDYVWAPNGIDIQSVEENTDAQWVKRIVCLFETVGIKSVKDGVLNQLVKDGINTNELLFTVTKERLLKIDGFKDKSSENIYQAITELRHQANLLDIMIGSCIFKGFGEKKLQKIITISEITNYILEDLDYDEEELKLKLNEKGFDKSSEVIINSLPNFKEYYDSIKEYFKHSRQIPQPVGFIDSESYCFTGFRDAGLEKCITEQGDVIHDNLTKSTTYLVIKDSDVVSSKIDKAKKYGVKIITKREAEEKYSNNN